MQKKGFLRNVFIILVIICFIVTASVGGFLISNYKNIGQFVQVASLVKAKFLWPVDTAKIIEGAISGMVDALDDEYSVYMNAEKFTELQSHIQGTFGGIGIYVGKKDDKITVIAPIEGTPGARAGIKAGDIIAKISGESTKDLTLDEAVALMKGESGTEVQISIDRSGADKLLELNITREIINIPTVRGEIMADNPEIAYIRISMFASNTDEAFNEEMNKLIKQGFKGLIVDLRDNPGGDLQSVVNIARTLIPEGPIVHIVDNKENIETYSSRGNNIDIPLVLLINEGSASASEILAGAVKDTKIGALVGKNTFGKGIVQTVYFLNDGAGLKLTTAKYLTPLKNDIHKKGVAPDFDIDLPDYIPGQRELPEDTQILKAVELIKDKLRNK